jgi:two-component system response regulator AtoC
MTTALIGKHGERLATKARVALLTRQTGSGLASAITRHGHDLAEFRDWSALVTAAAAHRFDIILCDEEFGGDANHSVDAPVVVLSERQGSAPSGAVSSSTFESGLDTFLALAVALAESNARCSALDRVVGGIRTGAAVVGRSPAIRRLQAAISRAADSDATVLIEGPAGSGKSLAARMIHLKSRRTNRPLVVVDGTNVGADALGRALEEGRATTLVIEEVDRLAAPAQALLVRHLKERASASAGGAPRIVTTTSAHLPELVARGAFREDLFYRLHSMPILVPALRERVEDIATIAHAILESSLPPTKAALSAAALAAIESTPWPGNVTQLEACLRRAQAIAGGATIEREHLVAPPTAVETTSASAAPVERDDEQQVSEESVLPFEEEEQRMLTRALRATKGNVRRAAQLLGIGRATLYRKIQQYQLRLQ